ncbi:tryptophan--tRNA ligase [Methanocella sp. CWC-04]|uniref:Tryptophan--tRNA ligase n=1 Tax=Methanooceanicella nereidis TaxID=2052831 RepID=A0AAP2RCZ6_9EURY|nr:tryptophan--tRNA ligase [Methanocella sp. CWC-04]MCD1295014.1 tryptophan--tRNA ligase [Methanocella sp. CWC-04]
MNEEFKVTPWDVTGKVDYKKLIEDFGTEPIDDELLARWERLTGSIPMMMQRKIFFSHRDLKWLLDRYEAGEKFVLYTGRGPSGHTHLGHLMPWMFTKYLQDAFDAPLYFQMTDDEKFMFKQDLSLKEAKSFTYENTLDIIALGFDPKKTKIFSDVEYIKTLYPIAIEVAKRVTFSTTKAVFGFDNSTNIGLIYFTSMQSAPAFLPSIEAGKNIPVLIPHAIDQDPHFRITRDVAPKIGYYKPASIHCTFLPSLAGSDKMSASKPETTIYTVDEPKVIRKKIMSAFTGGRVSIQEQKEKGGEPGVCAIFQYYYYLFEHDPQKLSEREQKCMRGEIMCGECKQDLADRVVKFLEKHQEKREQARDKIHDFVVSDYSAAYDKLKRPQDKKEVAKLKKTMKQYYSVKEGESIHIKNIKELDENR